jgi:hypothetical protein
MEHPVERLEEVGAVDAAQVGAGAERRALARDDDGPGTVRDGLVGGGSEGVAQVEVESVAALLALELDDDDICVAGRGDHGATLSAARRSRHRGRGSRRGVMGPL